MSVERAYTVANEMRTRGRGERTAMKTAADVRCSETEINRLAVAARHNSGARNRLLELFKAEAQSFGRTHAGRRGAASALEAEQAALLTLNACIDLYRPEKGHFTHFWRFLRSRKPVTDYVPDRVVAGYLDDLAARDDRGMDRVGLLAVLDPELERLNGPDQRDRAKHALRTLLRELQGSNPRQARIVRDFYWKRIPMHQIAVETGQTYAAVRKMIERIRKQLARDLRHRLDGGV